MKLPRYYLIAFGVMSLLGGLVYLLAPGAATEAADFGVLSSAAATDVRATYGGCQIAVGAFCLWSAGELSRVRGGLMLAAMVMGAIFVSRIIGLAIDGDMNEFHRSALAFEGILTAASLFVLRKA